MEPFPHRYDVHLTGGPSGYAQVSTPAVEPLVMAPPTNFGGPGDAWSPEHLLLASVQACLLFTLRAVARLSQLEMVALTVDATGIVDRVDGVTRFTEIVLNAQMTVPAGTNLDRARHVLEKSKKACLISASLSTPVRIASDIVELPVETLAAGVAA